MMEEYLNHKDSKFLSNFDTICINLRNTYNLSTIVDNKRKKTSHKIISKYNKMLNEILKYKFLIIQIHDNNSCYDIINAFDDLQSLKYLTIKFNKTCKCDKFLQKLL